MAGRRFVASIVGLLALSLAAGASSAPAAPGVATLPEGPVGDHLRAYIAATNSVGAAPALQFATVDLSPAFDEPHTPQGVQKFFANQRRVTGGVEPIGFRFEGGGAPEDKGDLVFKDTIYGGLHTVQFIFDDTPARRIRSISFVSPPAWAATPDRKLSHQEIAVRAAALIARGCRADVFSGAFLVAYKGRILVQRACGDASKRYHVANAVNTRFNIGSMSKMFTAVAVAQLVEQGRISLTDHLSDYLDESWIPGSISSQITLGQLLSMTSGLEDYFDATLLSAFQMNRQLEAYKPVIRGMRLISKPGEKYQYSDTAYFLLGLVVQQASGADYYDYIRQHIYAPAGMRATDSYPLDGPTENLATGYFYADATKSWLENRSGVTLVGAPDGGGYSTVGDLLRFAEALTSGKLVKPRSLDLLLADRRPPSGTGFFVLDSIAGRIIGKDGAGLGISAEMDVYLDKGWTVVSLSNYANGARSPIEAMRGIIAAAD